MQTHKQIDRETDKLAVKHLKRHIVSVIEDLGAKENEMEEDVEGSKTYETRRNDSLKSK